MKDLLLFVKEQGKELQVSKDIRIFQIGERPTYLYFLGSGWVKIGQEAVDGQDITLSLRKAGDLFGLAEILAEEPLRTRYASSLTDVTLYMLPAEKLLEFLKKNPPLWQTLCKTMAERLIETQNFVQALTNLSVPDRLGWFLCRFAERKDQKLVIELPLTHEEISNLVGCSRQKVTSNLSLWRAQGYIIYERGRIEVLDEAAIFPHV